MMITLDEYRRSLAGFYFTDCVVRSRSLFTFVASKYLTDEEVEYAEREMLDSSCCPKRVLPFMRDDPIGDQWGWTLLQDWDLFHGGASLAPTNQFVGIDLQGNVFATGSGVSEQEESIRGFREGGWNRGGVRKLKTIGTHLYACGGARTAAKRLGKNHWKSYSHDMVPHPEIGRGGFDDIDGFDETDIYAIGGKSDLWHFDGCIWQQLRIPTDTWTDTVCCADDGHVYIGGVDGLLLRGRGNNWVVLDPGAQSLGFRDIVSYEDRVWCTNDYGIWTIQQGKLIRAQLPSQVAVCAGHLYVNDGVLLVAGLGGAAFCESGRWHSILLRAEMEKLLRASPA